MNASDFTARLFDSLCHHVHAEPDRRGEVHIDCPYCGKQAKRGQTHFRFSVRGFKCWVCGESGSLKRLAEQLDAQPLDRPVPRAVAPVAPARPRAWQTNPQAVLERFLEAPDRLPLWQAYKPLTLETIARWKLGVGLLPSSACRHQRLIYPLLEDGRIVGFRGRSTGCDCPKWLTAGGSKTVLFGLELVEPGSEVILVENPVDALLAIQETPGVVAVASTAGAGTWREEWTQELRQRRPAHVTVWLDHDLAGNGSRYHWHEMVADWKAKHPDCKRIPDPNGPRIANLLEAAGIRASLYVWPKGTPLKYDLGSALIENMRAAA